MKVYVLMMAVFTLLICLFVVPFVDSKALRVILLISFATANILFYFTVVKDPGYVKKSERISFLKLNKYFDPAYLCPTCEIVRP